MKNIPCNMAMHNFPGWKEENRVCLQYPLISMLVNSIPIPSAQPHLIQAAVFGSNAICEGLHFILPAYVIVLIVFFFFCWCNSRDVHVAFSGHPDLQNATVQLSCSQPDRPETTHF